MRCLWPDVSGNEWKKQINTAHNRGNDSAAAAAGDAFGRQETGYPGGP